MANTKKFSEGTKIVIVEDDKLLGGLLSKMFTYEGCNIVYIESGEKVQAMVEAEAPNLILLDLLLPGMNGFDVLVNLKKNSKTKDIPVVILSCLGEKAEIKRGLGLGAVNYLIKATVTVEDIINEVSAIIQKINN